RRTAWVRTRASPSAPRSAVAPRRARAPRRQGGRRRRISEIKRVRRSPHWDVRSVVEPTRRLRATDVPGLRDVSYELTREAAAARRGAAFPAFAGCEKASRTTRIGRLGEALVAGLVPAHVLGDRGKAGSWPRPRGR